MPRHHGPKQDRAGCEKKIASFISRARTPTRLMLKKFKEDTVRATKLEVEEKLPFCLRFLRVLGLTLLCLLVGRGRLRAKSEATADCQWEPAWDSQQTNTWKSYTTIRVDKRALAKSIWSLKRSLLRHVLLPCFLFFWRGMRGSCCILHAFMKCTINWMFIQTRTYHLIFQYEYS